MKTFCSLKKNSTVIWAFLVLSFQFFFKLETKLIEQTCDTLMGLCVAWDEPDYVIKVSELMQRYGLHHQESSTYRTSLKMCWEFGNAKAAQNIFHAMEHHAQLSPKPTDVGLVVSTLCKSPVDDGNNSNKRDQGNRSTTTHWRKGWEMLQEAATVPSSKQENNSNDKAAFYTNVIPINAYNDILDCMKKEKRWKDSIRFLRWMEQGRKVSLDDAGISAKSMLQSNIGSSPTSKPLGFFIPTPTLSTYQTVIECCLQSQQVDSAVQILYDVTKRTKWTPKQSTFQVVLIALAKKLQWREAVQLLDFMIERDIPRTVVTYNTVISACSKAREVGMAKNLLHRMKQRDNIHPDEISFNSVIGACANTARWKEALEVLDQCYREPGVTPNIFIYTNAMR
jgi:pentatricopeptide repeat protein